jgi:drug/metabolite transporter (DMT)-like permease
MLGLGAINAVSYTLFFYLIETAGPVFSSQTANLVTLFGVLWGIIIFGEQHSAWVWLSLATMMAAVALVAPRQRAALAA